MLLTFDYTLQVFTGKGTGKCYKYIQIIKDSKRLKGHFKLICSDRIFEKIGFPENDFHVRQPHTLIDVGCIWHLNSKPYD